VQALSTHTGFAFDSWRRIEGHASSRPPHAHRGLLFADSARKFRNAPADGGDRFL
jgi:hypothetical protein